MTRRGRVLPAIVASFIGCLILLGLGVWQLQRLQWKQGLIAGIESRLAREAQPFDTVALDPASDFTKVTATGTYVPGNTRFVMTTFEGHAGWQVVTPLLLPDNRLILVDRGVIPDEQRPAFTTEVPPAGPQHLTGILRVSRDPPGLFMAANDPAANTWMWWDVPAMLASVTAPAGVQALPVTLQLVPGQPGTDELPRPMPPAAKLSNNHLQYALTWFAFAAVLLAVAALFVRQQMKKTAA